MRLIFEDTEFEFVYKIEIENIVYNRADLDEDIVDLVGENFATNLIRQFKDNSKFIRDNLEIEDFDVWFAGVDQPSILLDFACNKLVDDDTLVSTLGRYTTKPYEEEFETDDGPAKISFKPVRGELKVYLSQQENGK